jgi:hypothetical protein
MMFYIIWVLNYFTLLEINCHFCSIYIFFFVEIDIEINEVRRSEDVDGTKHSFCLNSCSSMTLYIIRVLDYSASLEINCHFCSIYTFSSFEIDTEIDEIRRSEDVVGTKNASYLKSCSSMTLYMIRASDYSLSSDLFHVWFLFCGGQCQNWWNLQIGRRWWNQECILFKLLLFYDVLYDLNFGLFCFIRSVPHMISLLLRSIPRLRRSTDQKILKKLRIHLV